MSQPLRSEVSNLQRLPSPHNRIAETCHWCAEPADSEVPTRTGLRWACSRCAPYVRAKSTTQPMGDDRPPCGKTGLVGCNPLTDEPGHLCRPDPYWRDPMIHNTNTTTKET